MKRIKFRSGICPRDNLLLAPKIAFRHHHNAARCHSEPFFVNIRVATDGGSWGYDIVLINDGLFHFAVTPHFDTLEDDGFFDRGPTAYDNVVGDDAIPNNTADNASGGNNGVQCLSDPEVF